MSVAAQEAFDMCVLLLQGYRLRQAAAPQPPQQIFPGHQLHSSLTSRSSQATSCTPASCALLFSSSDTDVINTTVLRLGVLPMFCRMLSTLAVVSQSRSDISADDKWSHAIVPEIFLTNLYLRAHVHVWCNIFNCARCLSVTALVSRLHFIWSYSG